MIVVVKVALEDKEVQRAGSVFILRVICLFLKSGTLPPALTRLLGHWNSLFIQGSGYRVRVLGVLSIWNLDLFAQQN